jgi:hypothetical protein
MFFILGETWLDSWTFLANLHRISFIKVHPLKERIKSEKIFACVLFKGYWKSLKAPDKASQNTVISPISLKEGSSRTNIY